MHELDVLDDNLKVIFCGINRPPSAERAGHNFSSSSNRFWTVLHRAGFTDVLLQPHEERHLLDYGYGITAVVDRATSKAAELSPHEFRQARLEFEPRMRKHAPRALAFLGKRAFAMMTDQPNIEWGLQRTRFADATTWILPNPSGLNRNFTLDALVQAYADFRSATDASVQPRAANATHVPRNDESSRAVARCEQDRRRLGHSTALRAERCSAATNGLGVEVPSEHDCDTRQNYT